MERLRSSESELDVHISRLRDTQIQVEDLKQKLELRNIQVIRHSKNIYT